MGASQYGLVNQARRDNLFGAEWLDLVETFDDVYLETTSRVTSLDYYVTYLGSEIHVHSWRYSEPRPLSYMGVERVEWAEFIECCEVEIVPEEMTPFFEYEI